MIHLIVGNTGSGKTTYSNRLKEDNGGVVFSIDKWNKTLFIPDKKSTDGLAWFLERIERSEEMILTMVEQLEQEGVDSILDLGLSKKEHRDKFREYAKRNKYEIQTHFLDIPKEARRSRILKRNLEKGETFQFEVSQKDFDFMEGWFERPTLDELEGAIVVRD